MRDFRTIVAKLKIVFFYNISNPEIQKHLDDCIGFTSILIFRGFVGSTDFRSSLCTVLVHLIL